MKTSTEMIAQARREARAPAPTVSDLLCGYPDCWEAADSGTGYCDKHFAQPVLNQLRHDYDVMDNPAKWADKLFPFAQKITVHDVGIKGDYRERL